MYVCEFFSTMIFVTGATGLLGSHLIQTLLNDQQHVTALYRSAIPHFKNSDKVQWIQGDILDMPLLEAVLKNVQQVYHCAAIVSFNPKRAGELYKTNVEGTSNIVNACLNAGVKKLLYVSSVAALGRLNRDAEMDETAHWSETGNYSVYGKTKYLAELEVWRGTGEGLQTVIVNPSIILGAGNWNEGSSQIFKTAFEEFPWYTDGVTGFVDVLDVVKAMTMLMNSHINAERFILNAENVRYKYLFDLIADSFKKKKPYRKVSPFLAGLIWRADAIRSLCTGSHPLVTKETAASAQAKVFFNNQKFLRTFPDFRYKSLQESISRISKEFNFKLLIK